MNNLRYYRERHGMTLEELGKKLGVSKATVHKWENGTMPVGLKYYDAMKAIFGVDEFKLCVDILNINPHKDYYKIGLFRRLAKNGIYDKNAEVPEQCNVDLENELNELQSIEAEIISKKDSPKDDNEEAYFHYLETRREELKEIIDRKQNNEISIKSRQGKIPPFPASNIRPISGMDGMAVPVIGQAAAASCNPGMMPLLDCVNEHSQDKIWFKQARSGDFAIEVSGTSMSPWYPDGTVLLVRPYRQDIRNGNRVVAVLENGEIVFKIYAEKGDRFFLFSIDGNGDDFTFNKNGTGIDGSASIRYICRVIASFRDEDALDAEMDHAGIRHGWQDKLSKE